MSLKKSYLKHCKDKDLEINENQNLWNKWRQLIIRLKYKYELMKHDTGNIIVCIKI